MPCAQVMRYMCSWSKDFYSEQVVTRTFVYDTPESDAKEKPVTWSASSYNQRKLGKPQILCFGFLLITPFHGFSRAFEGA